MGTTVDQLPELLEELFKKELLRQFDRETPMNAEELRFNIVSNLHYNMSDKDLDRYDVGIWDTLGIIQSKLLESYEFGDKIFRCITESGIPIYTITIEKKLNDPKFRRKMIDEIPNVSRYILDKLADITDHNAITNIFETIRVNNNIRFGTRLLFTEIYTKSFDSEMPIDRLSEVWNETFDKTDIMYGILDKLDEVDDIEPNVTSCLNDILTEQTYNCLKYLESSKGSIATAGALIFQIEINIINELQELIDNSSQAKEILGNASKFYHLSHIMSDFVEKEALTFVVEYMKDRTHYGNVRDILASFVKNYVKDRWIA